MKLERINGDERAKVFEQTVSSQIASLQPLLSDITFGDLSEGSLADRRAKLLTEISTAQKHAEAGTEGAADKLASLTRQLLGVSKEGYGTAGPEYASDQAAAASGLQRVIEIETSRAKQAAEDARKLGVAAETTAANTGDAAASLAEQASTLARQGGTLEQILAALSGKGGLGAPRVNTAVTARAGSL